MEQTLKEKIKTIIEEEIRPRIQMDGGDISFVDMNEEGIVFVQLKGACVGCFAAGFTLKMGIERYLKMQFDEVVSVENIDALEDDFED